MTVTFQLDFALSAPKYGYIIPKRAFDSTKKWAEHHEDAPPIASAE